MYTLDFFSMMLNLVLGILVAIFWWRVFCVSRSWVNIFTSLVGVYWIVFYIIYIFANLSIGEKAQMVRVFGRFGATFGLLTLAILGIIWCKRLKQWTI